MNILIKKVIISVVCVITSTISAINHSGTRWLEHACSKEKTHTICNHPAQPAAQVPATFGHTHFIVGMSVDDISQIQHESGVPSTNDRTVQLTSGSVRNAYFSPDDGLEKKLIDYIDHERASMKIAVFQFTNIEIARAIKRAQLRGVAIEIITDPLCLQDKFNKITWLAQEGLKIYVYNPDASKSTLSNKMHHKFVIFGKNVNGKKLLWIGSFNFTKSADIANQESVVVLDDEQIMAQFDKQYDRLKERSVLLADFAKNHFIVQAWQPTQPDTKNKPGKKMTAARAKKISSNSFAAA